MLHLFLNIIIINLIVLLNNVNSESILKNSDKLLENDLQICIDSFSIHKDKIIRTQDSLSLGAKYIMESDVDSRQECLKLCCKSEECDVFIFEEKKPGSCYLFHCGPPQDFKCTFSNHVNYTSAVLTNLSYRNTEKKIEEQIKRTQQEHELKSLRKTAERPAPEYSYITEPSQNPVTEAPKVILTTVLPVKTSCHRNQYECRTSGDCIAIYNVCDGIPQCSDGSDEASDLGCPTEKPTPPPPVIQNPPVPPPPEYLRYPPEHHKSYLPPYGNPEMSMKNWPLPLSNHPILPQQQQQQNSIPFPPPGMVLPNPPMNYPPNYNNNWDYHQMYDQSKNDYQVHEKPALHYDHQPLPLYNHEQSHIFNHKRPGMMSENTPDETRNNEPEKSYVSYYQHPNQEIPPQVETKEPTVQSKQQKIINQQTISTQQESIKSIVKPVPEKTQIVEETVSMKENASVKKELETQKHLKPSLNDDKSILNKNDDSEAKKIVQKTEDIHSELKIHHFSVEHLQQNIHKENNNDDFRPRSAVISLGIGLTLTVIMAILITCKIRVVKKRGRRHGSYAHDADYLVNGMYL